jgi:hypothetical protein
MNSSVGMGSDPRGRSHSFFPFVLFKHEGLDTLELRGANGRRESNNDTLS